MKHFLLFYIKSASHLKVAFDKAEWRLDLAGGNLNLIPPALAVSYGPTGRAGGARWLGPSPGPTQSQHSYGDITQERNVCL